MIGVKFMRKTILIGVQVHRHNGIHGRAHARNWSKRRDGRANTFHVDMLFFDWLDFLLLHFRYRRRLPRRRNLPGDFDHRWSSLPRTRSCVFVLGTDRFRRWFSGLVSRFLLYNVFRFLVPTVEWQIDKLVNQSLSADL